MKRPIEASEIRKGDMVRAERLPAEDGLPLAIEYHATYAGDSRFNIEDDPRYFLLDRPTPPVELPTEPTLGWLNNSPHLLAIWKDCSEGAVRPPCVRPVSVPTPFDDGHITAFTPAVAVPKAALEELQANHDCSGPLSCLRGHVDDFLAAVDEANA